MPPRLHLRLKCTRGSNQANLHIFCAKKVDDTIFNDMKREWESRIGLHMSLSAAKQIITAAEFLIFSLNTY